MPDDNEAYQNPIPPAIRRQAERAEQIAREIGVVNTPGLDEYQAEQAAAAAVAGGSGDGGEPPPSDGTPSVQEPPAESWEQRYRTLQGKYDAEIPVMRAQIGSLQQVISTMQAAPPASPAPPAPSAAPPSYRPPEPVVSAEDREMWGDDLPAAVSRWAEGSLGDRFDRLEQENQHLRQELDQVRAGQGQVNTTLTMQQVMTALDRDPDIGGVWRQLNEDPQYLAWLNQVDPFSGQFRMKLIREAYAQGDVLRCAQFFRSYLTGHTAPTGAGGSFHTGANGAGTNGAGDGASAGRVNLTSLVAPGRSSVTGTDNRGAQPEKRMWTNREIGAFYRDVGRGVFRGRDADKLALEQDIFAAAREGRVIQ